jgi:hypothetical protein
MGRASVSFARDSIIARVGLHIAIPWYTHLYPFHSYLSTTRRYGRVKLDKIDVADPNTYTFNYQRDTYSIRSTSPLTFVRLAYPSVLSSSTENHLSVPSCNQTQQVSTFTINFQVGPFRECGAT